jgi:hypothetical protein
MEWYEIGGLFLGFCAIGNLLSSIHGEIWKTNQLLTQIAEVTRDNQVNTDSAASTLRDIARNDDYHDRQKMIEKMGDLACYLDQINDKLPNRH